MAKLKNTTSLRSMAENSLEAVKDSQEFIHQMVSDIQAMDQYVQNMTSNISLFCDGLEKTVEKMNTGLTNLEKRTETAKESLKEYWKNTSKTGTSDSNKEADLLADYSKKREAEYRLKFKADSKLDRKAAQEELTENLHELEKLEKKSQRAGLSEDEQLKLKLLKLDESAIKKAANIQDGKGNDTAQLVAGELTELFSGSSEWGKTLGNISGILGKAGGWVSTVVGLLQGISKIASAISAKVDENVNAAIDLMGSDSVKKLDSRLYGLLNVAGDMNANFILLATDAVDVVGTSPLLKSTDLINNIVDLGNKGIAYNLELRALWQTMSDKIVSTFDATNEYLLRMIKLLQSDLTDTYMGVEASVTRALNSMYKDTLYLNGTFDSVYGALTDTLSTVGTDLGALIAYQVLMWLGSLSSLGLSDNAATSIATAINNLLTGDLTSMSEQGKKLLAMSASNAGISYADLLVNGVEDGKTMNTLLASMVKILQLIYESSEDNNAVLSAWGDVFGFELSDWKAISNLTTKYLETLTTNASILGYNLESALNEIKYISENLVSQRVLTSERVNNLIDNAFFNIGWDIASDLTEYLSWELAKKAKELTSMLFGEGSMVTKVTNVIADIVEGVTLLSNISGAISGLKSSLPTILNLAVSYTLFMDAQGAGLTLLTELFNINNEGGSYLDLSDVKAKALNNGSYYATTYGASSFLSKILHGLSLTDYGENGSTNGVNGNNNGTASLIEEANVDTTVFDALELPAGSNPTGEGWEDITEDVGLDETGNHVWIRKKSEFSGETQVPTGVEGENTTPESTQLLGSSEKTVEPTTVPPTGIEGENPNLTTTAPAAGINTKVGVEKNTELSLNYYNTAGSTESVTNSDDTFSNYTYDITDLYTLVTTGEGAKVRLVAVDPGVELKSTVDGNLNIDSGSLDGKIRSVVAEVIL